MIHQPKPAALLVLAVLLLTTTICSDSSAETGTVQDIDGNTYATVLIGDQWWMAENLRVTHDPQGNPIISAMYNNDPALAAVYGRLYTWNVAMDGSTETEAQGIAPDGWHIPSEADWQTLFTHLGGVDVAGGMLKEAGYTHWNEPNTGATNSSGFTGLPAGGFVPGGGFDGLGVGAHYWSTKQEGSKALIPTLHMSYASVILLVDYKTFYLSVRCVRDAAVAARRTTWSRLKTLY